MEYIAIIVGVVSSGVVTVFLLSYTPPKIQEKIQNAELIEPARFW